jgi:ribosomal 50S subunit-recycling heat shock protein
MRLDLFLKSSRLVIRRTIAQELCDAGYLKVNGVIARSSRSLKAEDVVELRRRNKVTTFRVVEIPLKKQVSTIDAVNLYQVLSEELLEELPLEILLDESENIPKI